MKKPRIVNMPEVKIAYDAHTDTLTLGSSGQLWESLGGEQAGLTVYISEEDGFAMGLTLQRAAQRLRTLLCTPSTEPERLGGDQHLAIAYYPDTDTLDLGIAGLGELGSYGEDIYGPAILVVFRQQLEGPPTGAMFDGAASFLRPYLCPECPPYERPRPRRRRHR